MRIRTLRVALIPGVLLLTIGGFCAQYVVASRLESAEREYWTREINEAATQRTPMGRFIERTLSHVSGKTEWQMARGKLVAHAAFGAKSILHYSKIVVMIQVDCQARVTGGVAEIEYHSL